MHQSHDDTAYLDLSSYRHLAGWWIVTYLYSVSEDQLGNCKVASALHRKIVATAPLRASN